MHNGDPLYRKYLYMYFYNLPLELQWLWSVMTSLSSDNKTVTVTCEVAEASPQAECLVTLNCTRCLDNPFTTKSFRGSIQLEVTPGGYYVITVQAVRDNSNDPLEGYIVTETLQIPKSKNNTVTPSTYV